MPYSLSACSNDNGGDFGGSGDRVMLQIVVVVLVVAGLVVMTTGHSNCPSLVLILNHRHLHSHDVFI